MDFLSIKGWIFRQFNNKNFDTSRFSNDIDIVSFSYWILKMTKIINLIVK